MSSRSSIVYIYFKIRESNATVTYTLFSSTCHAETNMKVLPLMTEYVVRQAKMNGARFLIDCYCGGGLFCITAAQMFEQCAGIEISGQAISQAKQNAAKNGIENCVFLAGTASDIFGSISFHHTETAIVIDPPRKGCDGTFLSQLARFSPSTIVCKLQHYTHSHTHIYIYIYIGQAILK